MFTDSDCQLSEKNFVLFAAKNYTNTRCLDIDEFNEDLVRFKYLKKLFSRYNKNKNELQERLILNHLTIIHNMFSRNAANTMCFYKIDEDMWPVLKTFLLYLNVIPPNKYINIGIDLFVAHKLQLL